MDKKKPSNTRETRNTISRRNFILIYPQKEDVQSSPSNEDAFKDQNNHTTVNIE
jgi:hypothetical protein